MSFNLFRRMALLIGLLCSAGGNNLASAQAWPTKSVRVVVHFPPGGSTDVVARLLAQAMSASLGQPVVIENKPGADGAIAAEFVMRAAPDGYTFLLASYTPMMQVPLLKKNPPYDPLKSFTPISLIGRYVIVLVASPSLPVQTAQELIAHALANPGKLNYGSYGGVTQLLYGQLKSVAKLDLNLIPYKGEVPAINDILGGHVQFTFATPTGTLAHVKEGRLKALAILLPARSTIMPDIPTGTEAGLPPLGADTWAAMFGPADVPPAIAMRMSDAVRAAIANPEVREKIDRQGFALGGSTPNELGDFMQVQLKGWAKAFADAGLKAE